ncbi:MAG TPA: glycosyltransferase family 4 protein [Candidatus Limnocylindrales bacterium]|jgi:glycosyltransferase involved in cell wall biosynthesis
MESVRPLRLALVAPPLERVPPRAYGGTERIVWELASELVRRGWDVTTFATGDSEVPGTLVPTVPGALRPGGFGDDPSPWFIATLEAVLDRASEFDLIHAHLEYWNLLLARISPVPVVGTFHSRLDDPASVQLLAGRPDGLVAISHSQANAHPEVAWTVIYNGLTLQGRPFQQHPGEDLCFVGRVEPEKGVIEAIEIAKRADRKLRIAAKIGTTPEQQSFYEDVFLPALEAAGSNVEFLGEVGQDERDRLFAESYATLMPGAWPEPFGLVAIESLACGTPIIARRAGALPEIIRDGVDGFFGDDEQHMAFLVERAGTLDRASIRASVVERFSASRMTDGYEALYARMTRRSGRLDGLMPLEATGGAPSIAGDGSTDGGQPKPTEADAPKGNGAPDPELVPQDPNAGG